MAVEIILAFRCAPLTIVFVEISSPSNVVLFWGVTTPIGTLTKDPRLISLIDIGNLVDKTIESKLNLELKGNCPQIKRAPPAYCGLPHLIRETFSQLF